MNNLSLKLVKIMKIIVTNPNRTNLTKILHTLLLIKEERSTSKEREEDLEIGIHLTKGIEYYVNK